MKSFPVSYCSWHVWSKIFLLFGSFENSMWLTYVGVKGEIVWPMVEPRASQDARFCFCCCCSFTFWNAHQCNTTTQRAILSSIHHSLAPTFARQGVLCRHISQPDDHPWTFPYTIQGLTKCTMFENHRESLIQHCERSKLRLHFEWTKVN